MLELSGSGKCTLLLIITELQEPTEGVVLVWGDVLRGVNPNVAIIFLPFALFLRLNVLENMELAFCVRDVPPGLHFTRALGLSNLVCLMSLFQLSTPSVPILFVATDRIVDQ